MLSVVECGTLRLQTFVAPKQFFFMKMNQLIRKTLTIGRNWKLRRQFKNAVRGRGQKLQQ